MTRGRRAARWFGGAIVVALLVGFASFGSIERRVATRAIAALQAAGFRASIGSLDLDLRRREVRARDLAIGDPGAPPFLTIRSLTLRVPWRALRGTIAIDEAALEGVRVTLRRAAGAAPARTASAAAKLALPPIGQLHVRDAAFAFVDAAGTTLFEASGVSIDGGTRAAGLQATLATSQPVRLRAGERSFAVRLGSTSLSLEKDDLGLDTILSGEGANARVTGKIHDAFGEPRLELAAKGSADANRLLDGVRGNVAFDATIGGQLASPELDALLSAPRLETATRGATSLKARLRANSQRATLATFEAATSGGRVHGDAQIALDGGASRLAVAWEAIDLGPELRARVPALAGWTGRARGRARLAFSGLEIAGATGTGEATIEPGAVAAGQVGIDARLKLNAGADAWQLEIEDGRLAGVSGFGNLSLARSAPPERAALTGGLTLRAPDLAASAATLAPGAGLEGLDGRADATLELGGTLEAPEAQLRVDGNGLGLRGDTRPRVTLYAELTLTRERALVRSMSASADGAQAAGTGSAVIESGVLAGEIRGTVSDLKRWAPESAGASGAAEFDLKLAGTLREPRAGGRLRSATTTLGGLPLLALDTAFDVDRSGLTIESLVARPAAGGRATVSGSLARAGDGTSSLKIRLEDADLTPLATATLPAATRLIVSGEAEISGPLADLDALRSAGRLQRFDLDLARGSVRLERDATWTLAPDRVEVDKLSLLLGEARFELNGRLDASDTGRLEAQLHGPLRDVARLVPTAQREEGEIPTRRDALVRSLNGAAAAELVWTGSASRPRARGTLSVRDGRALQYQTTLDAAYADGTLTLGHVVVQDARLRLEGNASFATSLLGDSLPRRFREEVKGLAPLAKLHLLLTRTDPGRRAAAADEIGTATLDLETDALDLAHVHGQVSLQNLDMNVEGERLAQQGTGRIQVSDGRLLLEGLSWRGSQSDFNLAGEARLAQGEEPFMDASLDLAAKGALDLRLLGGLGRGVEGGGAALVDLTLAGSPRAPQFGGSIELRDGLLRYRPKRVSVDGIQGRIRLDQRMATIETLTGSLNGGSFDATGAIDISAMPPPSGRIAAKSRGALLDWPRGTIAEVDSDLALVIENGVPRLEGDVLLASSSYDGNPLQLYTSFEAWRALPAEASALDGLELDVHVHSESELRADTQFGRLDIGADVRLGGTLGAPALDGRIEAGAGGTVLVGRRTYTLEHLTLDFSPSSGLIPFVRSRATTRIASHEIVADFTGPLDAPQTRLTSAPPLSENEIASLLTTGSVDQRGASGDAVGLVTANLLGSVGRSVGFDTLRLEGTRDDDLLAEDRFSFDPTLVNSAADPDSRLTLTKRLSPELEVTLSQALASGGKRTTLVSWRPIRNVEGRAVQRDDQTYALEARHDVKFGGASQKAASPRPRAAKTKEHVGEIRIKTDSGPSAAELERRLKLGRGDRFDYRSWLKDRDRLQEALAQAGFYEARIFGTREPRLGAETAEGTVALSYEVKSGNRTAVRFEGFAAPVSLKRDLERSWWQSEFDSSIEEEAVTLTRAALLDAGHPTPTIDATETQEPNSKVLVVAVDPGPRASHRDVVFVGNEVIAGDRLKALVKGKEAERRAFMIPRALANDVQVLLAEEGFLNATVKAETTLKDGVATLLVTISEGARFTIGVLAAAGVARLSESEVLQASGLVTGATYAKTLVDGARVKLLALYRNRGFVDAAVRVDGRTRRRNASVDTTLHVSEGPRQVLAEVVFDGGAAAASLVREAASEGGVTAGKPVVVDEWSEVRRRIYESGLVRQVDLQAEPLGPRTLDGDQPVRALFTVENWPALRLRYGLQLAGTRDPLDEAGRQQFRPGAIAELTRQTLFGRAISTGLSIQGRQGFQSARGYLTLPRTFGTRVRSSVFATEERADRFVPGAFGDLVKVQADTSRLTFEERIKLFRLAGLALAYSLEWDRFRGEIPLFGPLDVRERLARLTGSLVFDRRDSVIDATRGFFQSSGLEYSSPRLGSEHRFSKLLLQQYGYLGSPTGTVLASAVRWERAAGDQLLLTSGRLSAGGANTVRGYPEDLGGSASLIAAPGAGVTSLVVFNQEVRIPLRGSLFGGAFFDHASRFLSGEGRILSRSSIGLGLRFRTSVGVLRVDYGYPLGQGKRGTFYFALGQAF